MNLALSAEDRPERLMVKCEVEAPTRRDRSVSDDGKHTAAKSMVP